MGMEIQLREDNRGEGTPNSSNTGSIYQVVASKEFAANGPDEWNDLHIATRGNRIKVTLNGKLINDARQDEYPEIDKRPRHGFIGLSAHPDVEFKNIRLRSLPDFWCD